MQNIDPSILYMIISGFFGSLMSILIKMTQNVSFLESTFFRSVVVILMCYVSVKMSKNRFDLLGKKENRKLLLSRGVFGGLGLCGFYYSIINLSYTESITIKNLSPVFTILIAALFFKQKVRWFHVVSVILSFGGTGLLIVSQNGEDFYDGFHLDHFISIVAASFSGVAYNVIAKLKASEPSLVVMNYLGLFTLAVSGIGLVSVHPTLPSTYDMSLLTLSGISAFLMQLFLTKSYAQGKTASVAAASYFNVLYSPLIGLLFFDEVIDSFGVFGVFILFFGLSFPIIIKALASSMRKGL